MVEENHTPFLSSSTKTYEYTIVGCDRDIMNRRFYLNESNWCIFVTLSTVGTAFDDDDEVYEEQL